MPLARLEIEIDSFMAMKVVYENRYGERHAYEGAAAWQVYRTFAHGGEPIYRGTLDEIRTAYVEQLTDVGLNHSEIAERLGISARAHRYWRKGRPSIEYDVVEPQAKIHLAPQANVHYEERALREAI